MRPKRLCYAFCDGGRGGIGGRDGGGRGMDPISQDDSRFINTSISAENEKAFRTYGRTQYVARSLRSCAHSLTSLHSHSFLGKVAKVPASLMRRYKIHPTVRMFYLVFRGETAVGNNR